MSLESALRTHLLTSEITAVVGDKIYPLKIPADEQLGQDDAAITYEVSGRTLLYSMDGSTGLYQAEIQIICWSPTYLTAKYLAGLVRDQMEDFSGEQHDVDIRRCFFRDEDDRFTKPDPGADVGLPMTLMEFEIWLT